MLLSAGDFFIILDGRVARNVGLIQDLDTEAKVPEEIGVEARNRIRERAETVRFAIA